MKLKSRLFGEYLTFGVSLAIIAGLFLYLLFNIGPKTDSPHLTFEVTPVWKEIKKSEAHFILPVDFLNKGGKTAKLALFRLKAGRGSSQLEQEIKLEYLDRNSPQRVFVLLPFTPVQGELEVTPLHYIVD